MSEELPVAGGCLCGAVRFESVQPPFHVCYCHCGMCRKGVGNVVGAWAFFPRSAVKFTKGRPSWFQSSATVSRGFCRNCGSPIAFSNTEYPHICIAHGALDEQAAFPPRHQWYLEDGLPFVDFEANLEQISELPEDARSNPDD